MPIKFGGFTYKPHGYRLVRDKDNVYYEAEQADTLRFLAVTDSTIGLTTMGSGFDVQIEYKLGDSGTWTPYDTFDTMISVPANQTIHFRNRKNTLSIDFDNYIYFVMTGEFRASGPVASMINHADLSNYCFNSLFGNCESLKSAPILPNPVVGLGLPEGCYLAMFSASGIVEPPLLHLENAITPIIGKKACMGMFAYCPYLYRAPKISCVIVEEEGCFQMFGDCIALEVCEGVEVEQDIRANGCAQLFNQCVNLHEIKSLRFPIVHIGNSGCSAMFTGCNITDLSNVTIDTQTIDGFGLSYMFVGCENLVKGIGRITSDLSAQAVCTWMYAACTKLTDMTEMTNVTKVSVNGFDRMYIGCEELVNVYDLTATEGDIDCYNNMFFGCSKLTRAPRINLTQLYDGCCTEMFRLCSSLNISKGTGGTSFFKCPDTSGFADNPVEDMFYGCLGDSADPMTGDQCFYN